VEVPTFNQKQLKLTSIDKKQNTEQESLLPVNLESQEHFVVCVKLKRLSGLGCDFT